MKHFASPTFWQLYNSLDEQVRLLADQSYAHMKANPRHPAVMLKRIGKRWSARVGIGHRVLGVDGPDGIVWVWIGSHEEYDRLLRNS